MSRDLDSLQPKVNVRWEDQLLYIELSKGNDWSHIRIVGGIFSYGLHWVKFIGKEGAEKIFPVTCTNYSPDSEKADLNNNCPACAAGIKYSTKYLLNVIDRKLQRSMRSGSNPVRVLALPPTAINQIISLRQLNIVDGNPVSVANVDNGCDIAVRFSKDSKKSEWTFSLGKSLSLTEEEKEYELFDFDSIFIPSDNADTRRSLIQKGYKIGTETVEEVETEQQVVTSSRVEEVVMPTKKAAVKVAPVQVPVQQEEVQEDTQEELVEEATDAFDSVDDVQPVEEVEAAPVPEITVSPVAVAPKRKLGAPPVTTTKIIATTEAPDCFATGTNGLKFLRGVKCLKCAHKTACASNTNAK